MRPLPTITGDRRWTGLLCLTIIALGQAGTMLLAAFATRDVVAAMRTGDGAMPSDALAGLVVAGVAMFVLRSLEGAIAERTGQSYAAAIRRKLFVHMSRVPVSAMAERRVGALALRYVGDLSALKGWMSKGLSRLISAAITIPAAFAILYALHPSLAAGAAVPVAGALLVILLLGPPIADAHGDLRARRARLAGAMAERLPQALALRRSGRIKTELRALDSHSQAIARRAVYRAWLTESVRGLPDIASGVAGAICLWICLAEAMPVEDAVAALTALALVVWPLRRLADVWNRHKAFAVAAGKLRATLSAPTIPSQKYRAPKADAPALVLSNLRPVTKGAPVDVSLARGEMVRLTGPSGAGKSRLLSIAAGLEKAPAGRVSVAGLPPAAVPPRRVLYLGRYAPKLKGTLRRECTLGLARVPDDAEITIALAKAGLMGLHDRLGGLSGQVAEGRGNLTSTEIAGIYLVRGLLAKPDLALIDADEIGLTDTRLATLLDHLTAHGAAILVAKSRLCEGMRQARTLHLSGSAGT